MAAATRDLDDSRQPGQLVDYGGASGWLYYKNTLLIKASDGVIRPGSLAGVSGGLAHFLGVNANRVDLSGNLGSSQATLNVWKTGVFNFVQNGTGVSADIGKRVYLIDDQTVGTSVAIATALPVGEIVSIPTSTLFGVRIDAAVSAWAPYSGLSGFSTQN